jgi:GTP-binding protein
MEGRDIGTVVFPDADVKLFLGARADERERRRERERALDPGASGVAQRDAQDARTTPLEPAPDAEVLDTTTLDADAVREAALARVRRRLVDAGPPAATTTGTVPRVAIVGRPNVGKSTLTNRIVGRRRAIAHETAGVTRDRLELPARWGGRSFLVVDTGGIMPRPRGLDAAVVRQAVHAIDAADLVLLVVDATAGITEEDARVARDLRRGTNAVLVVANKVDGSAQEPLASEFHGLGLGDPVPVSALHGRGSDDLLDQVVALLPEPAQPDARLEDEPRFCLVGRPNVGKSSLFNRMVRDERAVVHDEAGTTRDSIDSLVTVDGRTVRFIDTAGMRPVTRTQGIEYYGLLRSVRAIEGSHVALLVVDASEGLVGEDKRIAARIVEAGRGLVVVLNKWDLIPSGERADRFRSLADELRVFPGTPVLRASALTGRGVGRVAPALFEVHAAWTRRVPTADVNRVLQRATEATPPPRGFGRLKYATQTASRPPTFVVFGLTYPGASYQRYLEHALRGAFGFPGVPVRVSFRGRGAGGRTAGRRRR